MRTWRLDRIRDRTIDGEHWGRQRACRGSDPNLFGPMTRREVYAAQTGGTVNDKHDVRRVARVATALDICSACPVWKECAVVTANLADERTPYSGIYGRQYVGNSEAARRRDRALDREERLSGVQYGFRRPNGKKAATS